jgi:hypothetical protein
MTPLIVLAVGAGRRLLGMPRLHLPNVGTLANAGHLQYRARHDRAGATAMGVGTTVGLGGIGSAYNWYVQQKARRLAARSCQLHAAHGQVARRRALAYPHRRWWLLPAANFDKLVDGLLAGTSSLRSLLAGPYRVQPASSTQRRRHRRLPASSGYVRTRLEYACAHSHDCGVERARYGTASTPTRRH